MKASSRQYAALFTFHVLLGKLSRKSRREKPPKISEICDSGEFGRSDQNRGLNKNISVYSQPIDSFTIH